MYDNDKKQRITLRLNDSQFDFVKTQAEKQDITPSEWLRQIVNSIMYTTNQLYTSMSKSIENNIKIGDNGRENDKTDINN